MNRFLQIVLWILNGIGLVGGLLFLMVSLFAGWASDGALPSFGVVGISVLFAVVELTVVLLAVRFTPLWPRAGAGYVLAAVLWGATVSPLLVFPLATASTDLPARLGLDLFEASWGGAYPEETVKSLGVLIILFSFRPLVRPWHGFVTGVLVGIGFEVVENALYAVVDSLYDPVSDMDGMLGMWGLRMIGGPFLHVLFTGMVGWGIGVAVFTAGRSRLWRLGTGLVWVGVAFTAHFCWNIMYVNLRMSMVSMAMVALVVYPLFIWVSMRAWRFARADSGYVLLDRPVMSVHQLEQGGFTALGAGGARVVYKG
ncbi:PrsW family intramembrane metalloprotease [Corynebacterium sp. CCM 9185]|uniref:PrsW family intramembrane metalloprotease n=1 Tax=Corynebacterium marambiense TaxID=2765364 RepID=A0ABS0VTR3_9CORY|nr:PrsW family intramembrane metalloprotease [Corynebacterium marambiense]MBI8999704.1 PrsW family intramembrane metalloprotease [Corynebacterium marambiense]MCK7662544.1 PrsW family intramembrane metalloprotease [Corynebacterium marambiense]